MLGRVAPPELLQVIADQITKISQSNRGGILTFAFLLTLWSSSGAMVSIISTLNTAYDITESRPLWKVRLTAVSLTIGMAIFILLGMALVLAGPSVAEQLASRAHLGPAFKWAWWVLQWPVVFVIVATAIGIVYYFAPDAEQEWVWITPGSVLATALWIVVSLAFKLYLAYFGSYNETYGTLGAFIVVLTWFYLSGLAILIGAELNAEIEHASPYGKDVGERVPGEKRQIGALAERVYEERKARGELPVRPLSDGVNCDVDVARSENDRQQKPRTSDLIIGAAVLLPAALELGRTIRNAVRNGGKKAA
jgi:membrane protein